MTVNIHRLKNGIWVVHTPASGVVCHCGLVVNTGSRDERDDEHGMAHFIEHVVFKGTKHRRAFHILSRLDEVGGELNAYTTKEETVVHASFLARDFQRAADLIADMVFHSVFPERELAKEKEVIADEISSYRDTPSEMIFDDFEEQLFRGSPLAHNILGSVESISSFNAQRAHEFMQRNYHTDQMAFSVCGNLPFNVVVRVAEKYFGDIAPNLRQCQRANAVAAEPQRVKVNKGTHQCHIVMGTTAPSCFQPLRLPVFLLNNMLGGPCMNSRLSILLRERNGIAYNVETAYTPWTDTGLFTLYFGTDAANLSRSLRIVERELQTLCTKSLTDSRLQRIKRQCIGQLMMSTENGESQMLSSGRSVILYGLVDDIDLIVKKIEAVTAAEMLEAANLVVAPERLSQLIYH